MSFNMIPHEPHHKFYQDQELIDLKERALKAKSVGPVFTIEQRATLSAVPELVGEIEYLMSEYERLRSAVTFVAESPDSSSFYDCRNVCKRALKGELYENR